MKKVSLKKEKNFIITNTNTEPLHYNIYIGYFIEKM